MRRNITYECWVSQSVFYEVLNAFVYVSITKHPFEGHEILITKTTVLIWKWKAHFIKLHTIWFMISEKNYNKVHISSWWCMPAPNVNKAYEKLFQPFTLPLCGLVSGFYWSEHVYTYRSRQEFLKHSWKKNIQLF